jgi:hypothetical protein
MPETAHDRRVNRRYELRLALHYRMSQKGEPIRSGSGVTCDMSSAGLSFRCRKPLPAGVHIEILIEWPVKHGKLDPVALQVTGFVVRSDDDRTAVCITSHKFRVTPARLEPARASA